MDDDTFTLALTGSMVLLMAAILIMFVILIINGVRSEPKVNPIVPAGMEDDIAPEV